MDELAEPEHVAVVGDELVHLAEPDVADAVVDLEEAQPFGGAGRLLDLAEARREDAVVVAPIDERVDDLAVRVDRAPSERAVLVGSGFRVFEVRPRASRRGLAPGASDVVDGEGDVVHAVAVAADVVGDLAIRRERGREDERDVVAPHHVAGAVPDPGLQAGERDRGEAPQRAVVRRRLAGIADPELHVVDALERQEVLRLGVSVLVEPGAGLVGGALGRPFRSLRSTSVRGDPAPGGAARTCGHPCYASHATLTADGRAGRSTRGRPRGARRAARRGREPRAVAAERAYGAEPESDWGPKEVLAHVGEMAPYWLSQVEVVLAGSPEPVPFGRVATDPERIDRIGRDRSLPAGELFDRIDAGLAAVGVRLAELEPAERARRGLHSRLGEMTVEASSSGSSSGTSRSTSVSSRRFSPRAGAAGDATG